jgi:hypothetical protein
MMAATSPGFTDRFRPRVFGDAGVQVLDLKHLQILSDKHRCVQRT